MQIAHLDARVILFVALGVFAVFYIAILAAGVRRPTQADEAGQSRAALPALLATGFVTNFFDTLGIGSFATTTTIFRHWKLVRDERHPGHAERRAHPADHRAGVHLHDASFRSIRERSS